MDTDMQEYRVEGLPDGLYYIADFISPEEQQSLLDKVNPCNAVGLKSVDPSETMDGIVASTTPVISLSSGEGLCSY